jgi:DNA-binding transcriptional LysR family regulator
MNLIVVLDALLQERSVRLASKRLALSPPAASRALGRLRASLRDQLFTRTRKGMVPTTKALAMAGDVRRAVECMERVFRGEAEFNPESARRVFRLAMTDLLQAVLLPPLIARLDRVAPKVRLVIEPRTEPERFEALRDGGLDMVVALAGQYRLPSARETELFRDELVCILRADGPRRRLSLSQYVRARHVVVAPHGLPGSLVDDALMQRGLRPEVAFVVPHFSTATLLVASSGLVATVPAAVARTYPGTRLRLVRCPLELPSLRFCAFTRDAESDQGLLWLSQMLRDVAASVPVGARVKRPTARLTPLR